LIPVTSLRVLTWNPGCAIHSQGAPSAMISAQRFSRSTRWSQVRPGRPAPARHASALSLLYPLQLLELSDSKKALSA
jgi:hypothetical protein